MPQKQKIKSVKEKIQERANKAISEFKEEAEKAQIRDTIVENTIQAYNSDIQNFNSFPESLKFKNFKEKPDNEEDLAFYLLSEQLKKAYKTFSSSELRDRFVKEYFGHNGKKVYRCSICGQLLETKSKNDIPVADIDHIFPKDQYAQFAMHFENFIPTCKECNQTEKGTKTITLPEFKAAFAELGVLFQHPLRLWENIKYDFNDLIEPKLYIENKNRSNALKLIELYGIDKRYKVILKKCYNNLFCHIKNAEIRSPESLEKLIEGLLLTNMETTYNDCSLNNHPQVWQEFTEWILYSESNLLALWEEIRDYSTHLNNYSII